MKNKIREYHLTASEFEWQIEKNKTVRVWGFNRQLPGPVLTADKADTLVVHFKNDLNEPTIIHWHGLRVSHEMDGTDFSQQPIGPGETFEYRLDLNDSGTFWFHSHFNETEQIEKGMYGSIVVRDELDPVVDGDRVILLDDMKLRSNNDHASPSWFLPRWLERHNGREGNVQLVNGQVNKSFEMRGGQIERWRLINVSNARYYRLSFDGLPFRLISSDGGFLGSPVEMTELLITPGERYDILLGPFGEGEQLRMVSLPYNRGVGRQEHGLLATLKVGPAGDSKAEIPAYFREIPALAPADAKSTRNIVLHGKRSWKDGVDFTINGVSHLNDEPVHAGELQVWEISNPSMMDHPFHLHGFFFQVLSINGVEPAFKMWKDTVNIRKGETVRIAWMPDERTGSWMYHCHILEHHAAGMMASFNLVNKSVDHYSSNHSSPSAHTHHFPPDRMDVK